MEQIREEESQKLSQILAPDQMKRWNSKQTLSDFSIRIEQAILGGLLKGVGET